MRASPIAPQTDPQILLKSRFFFEGVGVRGEPEAGSAADACDGHTGGFPLPGQTLPGRGVATLPSQRHLPNHIYSKKRT